jgi:RluA family pseudouridine synthase
MEETLNIPLLLETDDLLAVDKPEGIASIPERDRDRGSVLKLLEQTRGERLYVVHRLDKEVSGVLLFARNGETHKLLNDQFAGRNVRKSYLAVVHGVIAAPGGSIVKPLRQFGSGRVGVDEKGRIAETDFDVEDRWDGTTLVKVHPRTGRRHQIRVHFYAIGHPIVGDLKYGDRNQQSDYPRLMLHALTITFMDRARTKVSLRSEPPPSFTSLCDRLRSGSHMGGS